MINFLHIIQDDKFFRPVAKEFSLDTRLNNQYLYIKKKQHQQLEFIQENDNVTILYEREDIRSFFQNCDCQVVMIHSLPKYIWDIVLLIPSKMKVIWWGWGYDIYLSNAGSRPFINIDDLKDATKSLANNRHNKWLLMLKELFDYGRRKTLDSLRDKVLQRIDFFEPVLQSEYNLMQSNTQFRAKEFYYKNSIKVCKTQEFLARSSKGHILFGNSATYTNNHLDVVKELNKLDLTNRKIYVPVSYGFEVCKKQLKASLKLDSGDIVFLEDFMPREEYFKLLSSCSFFVSGVIRQQALGNIFYCIINDIKVFLYRDSIVYKDLKDKGFVVYAIEDMNNDAISKPITKEESEQNRKAYYTEAQRRDKIYEDFIYSLTENN